MSKQNAKSVEAWELTAFVLGELDQEHAQRIQKSIDGDLTLAAELAEIQQTIGLVRGALETEDRHLASIAGSDAANVAVPVELPHPRKEFRIKWVGLLAMSACLLVAVVYSSGLLNDWLLVDNSSKDSISLKEKRAELASSEPLSYGNNQAEKQAPVGPGTKEQAEVLKSQVVRASDPTHAATSPTTLNSEESSKLSTFTFEGTKVSPKASSKKDATTAPREPSDQDDVVFESFDLYSKNIPSRGLGDAAPGGTSGGALGQMGGAAGRGGMGMGMGGMGMGGQAGMGIEGEAIPGPGMGGMAMGGWSGSGMEAAEMEGAGMRPSAYVHEQRDEKEFNVPNGWNDLNKRRLQPSESNTDRYQAFNENQFELVEKQPLSTFSIDVDTASYAKCRQLLLEAGQIPPASAVRLEEFVNYFDYEYATPTGEHPFATHLAASNCPWQAEHKLVRVALQSAKPNMEERGPANVVFLLDVSGSMSPANKLPLVKDAMRMMIERLTEKDRVAIVVYAGAAGCVLEGTPGNQQATFLAALDRLQAGGSTNGGDGIQLAYQLARDQFIPGGNNRVVLCTDGDFNVGVTSTQQLVELVAQNAKSKIFLTVLGFGMGNTNDAMMEQISNRGNGVYGFVDSWREAKRQMVDQLAGNLITVAKDVKIQVEFNPKHVKAYRLLGYENRMLAAKDFNDDTKDAGEIGAGHRVTAFYEVVPVGVNSGVGAEVDDLLFQPKKSPNESTASNEEKSELAEGIYQDAMMAVKLRYKQPEGDVSQKLVVPLANKSLRFQDVDRDFRWAASMVQFGMLLRKSQYLGSSTWSGLLEQAREAAGVQPDAQRDEALQMMERASRMQR
jgi:Ca-activated chloride channel homolog